MRKEKILVAFAILVLVLAAIMLVISNTSAKYVTSANGTDSARVAHWNINTTNNIKDLFASSYMNVAPGSEEQGIIAPGTSGTYSFTIDGDVETAYTLSIRANGNDEVNGAVSDYNPIKYSFTKPNTGDDKAAKPTVTTENMTFEELKSAINNIDDGVQVHNAGSLGGDTYTIGWTWELDGNDEKDTLLGNLVSKGDKTISLSVNIVVTQAN